MLNTILGTYGSENTECDIFTLENDQGTWYAVSGSVNVNLTYDTLTDGVNVETVNDVDCFTLSNPIETVEQLEHAINS